MLWDRIKTLHHGYTPLIIVVIQPTINKIMKTMNNIIFLFGFTVIRQLEIVTVIKKAKAKLKPIGKPIKALYSSKTGYRSSAANDIITCHTNK